MGCFNTVCQLSGLQITSNEKVYYGFVTNVDQKPKTRCGGGMYMGDQHKLITPLMVGTYNEYGWLNELDLEDGNGPSRGSLVHYVTEKIIKNTVHKLENISGLDELREVIMSTHFDKGCGILTDRDRRWATQPFGYKEPLTGDDLEKSLTRDTSKLYLWAVRKDVADALAENNCSKEYRKEIKKKVEEHYSTDWFEGDDLEKVWGRGDEWHGAGQFYGVNTSLMNLFFRPEKNTLDSPDRKQDKKFIKALVNTCIIMTSMDVMGKLITPFHGYGGQGFDDGEIKNLEIILEIAKKKRDEIMDEYGY